MFITGNRVHDTILGVLAKNDTNALRLALECGVSVQSIHKILKKLLQNKVVLKNKTKYTLNQEWVNSISSILSSNALLNLSPGEKIQYDFNNLDHLERFWKHALFPLIISARETYIYNPHWIWWYLPDNFNSEANFVRSFDSNHLCYILIGSTNAEDKEVRKQWQHNHLRITLDDCIRLSRKHFYTVVDNYVITTIIPKAISDQIDAIYNKNIIGDQIAEQLGSLLSADNLKIKLKVEYNVAMASKLKRLISKDFIIG